jgi:aspartate racemase
MENMKDKIVGILGGVGPEATAELFRRVIKATAVKNDQEHLRIIIDNNPQIPDRTLAIMGKGESPLDEMIKTSLNLERAGAVMIAIPCNTAHHYLNDLRKNVHVPVLDMILETSNYISTQFPGVNKVGLLATTGTVTTQLYQHQLRPREVLSPEPEVQEKLMDIIYGDGGIKRGFTKGAPRRGTLKIARLLINRGAQVIIAGCTELSLVLREEDLTAPLVDPLKILALAIVREAKARAI